MEELMNTSSTVITYTDYRQYKAELDAELQKSAESFVRIGYLLKVARDTGILKESGYANVNEFAEKEYNIDKTQVSRFIRINDRFSEDGYSETLKAEYKGYGYAKLAIMLQLPDSVTEELSPEYSKSEIQAIKEEYDEEQKVTDLEVMMEETDEVQQSLDNVLYQAAYQIGKDMPELYVELWESLMEKHEGEKEFIEHLAPSGTKTYTLRIPGKGRMMLMIRDTEDEVKLLSMRDATDKNAYPKTMLVEAFKQLFYEGDAKTSWGSTYGEDFPEKKEEVAPVQQKKESKVVKAKVEQPKSAPKEPEPVKAPEPPVEESTAESTAEPAEPVEPAVQQSQEGETMTLHEVDANLPAPDPKPEEEPDDIVDTDKIEESEEQQLPGRDSIENHPEYMPDPEDTAEKLQTRAYEIVKMTLSASLDVWKGKQMPLESVQKNKERAQELVEVLTKLEALVSVEEEEETEEKE